MYSAIVLDIEGTTTPIAFVYDVLFPYARAHLPAYLADPAHGDALREPLRMLRDERNAESPVDGPPEGGLHVRGGRDVPEGEGDDYAYLEWLMDRDRKSPGLKLLQGLIWEQGYRTGDLRGQVFPDVAPALRRWRAGGVEVAIYSSGSELAQRLLFGSTGDGDLVPFISRFFDTRVGAKASADSYRLIAAELRRPAGELLFVSDVPAELDAAREAGCQTALCVRPGNHPQPPCPHTRIATLDEIRL